jgi:hypothetical protein
VYILWHVRTTLLGAACRHGVAIRASATRARGGRPETINCRCPACPVSCSSLPLHSQLQYVVVGVRASEQPRDGSAAFPWPWTACMVWPVMEPGDGTCITYACVCLRAAWNCACGTSAVVHAYARLYTYVQRTRAWQRDQCMVCFMYVYMYVRTRHRSRALAPAPAPARYDGGGQARCPTPCRRSDPCPCLIPGLESRVVPEGGGTHAGHLHATVRVCIYICMAVRCAARGEGVRVRGTMHALRYYSVQGRCLLQHTVLSDRSGHACMHVGASIIQGTRVCPIFKAHRTIVCSQVLYIELRLPFVPRRVFFFLCGLESALLETSDMARDIHVLYRELLDRPVCTTPFTRPSPNDRLFFF